MAGDYRLDGLAVPESLEELHGLLDTVRSEHPHVAADDLMMFETAIVEIHGNVIKHGRPHGRIAYTFTLRVSDACLEGCLSTVGDAPAELPPVREVDPMAESGRGLWLAQAALDELKYSRAGEQNRWQMVKRITGATEPPSDA